MSPLHAALEDARVWGEETFPESTPKTAAIHMAREANELKELPFDDMEIADVFILAFRVGWLSGHTTSSFFDLCLRPMIGVYRSPKALAKMVWAVAQECVEAIERGSRHDEIAATVAGATLYLASLVDVDPAAAIATKMALNRARTWGAPDSDGVREHVRDGEL